MLAQVRAGGIHQVATYKLDRLGRRLTHLAIIVGTPDAKRRVGRCAIR